MEAVSVEKSFEPIGNISKRSKPFLHGKQDTFETRVQQLTPLTNNKTTAYEQNQKRLTAEIFKNKDES